MSDGRTPPVKSFTGTVTYRILVDGKELPMSFELYSLTTHKEVNRIPFAKLVFRDGSAAEEDFEASNAPELSPGKEVEIQAGYDSKDATIFKGIIVKHGIKIREAQSSVLEIECRDKSVKMTLGRKNKFFAEVKDSDAMSELIDGHGLTSKTEATTLKHKELVQFHCTDWDFLLSRAEANSQVVLVSDGVISIKKPVFSGQEAITLIFGDSLYEFEAEMDARHQYKEVSGTAWDPATQGILSESGAPPAPNPQGDLSESDLAKVIGLDKYDLKHGGIVTGGELKSWADAQLMRNHLAKIVGRAKLRGFPDISPGQLAAFSGVGNHFTGKAYVTAVRHEMNAGDWYTHIQFGRLPAWFHEEFETMDSAAAGLMPGVHGLQIGIVTALQGDPNSEFRIKVRFPVADAQSDGIWARLASLDAGKDRGWVFRPEIGDEVIVGFLHSDPRYPVVLGMLHSSANAAPIEAKDENHEKGLVTRSKMKVHFDDDKKILTLETPAGKKIILDEDQGNISILDENNNKIVLDSKGITIESCKDLILKATKDVKMEGVNIEQKAQAQFKAEGGAGMEVKSSAVTVLKGSLVQIN